MRPVTRAGNRRYYRPQDVVLVQRIDALLNREGYTIRGVQQLLAREGVGPGTGTPAVAEVSDTGGIPAALLIPIRDRLESALRADR